MNNIIDDKFKNFILSPDDYNFEKLLQTLSSYNESLLAVLLIVAVIHRHFLVINSKPI